MALTPMLGRQVASRIRAIDLPPFDLLNTRAAQLRAKGHKVISLGQAVPFFSPPGVALERARAALERGETNFYSADAGLAGLREALAERLHATTGIDAGPDDLIITAGGNQAFTVALTTLVDPGDEVILPAPYFTNHEMAVRALGAIPVEAPTEDRETFAVRWSDIAPRLTARTRAVVTCNPNNPTGAVLDASEGRRIVAELGARGIVVISDETYMHFVYSGEHWSAASAPDWRRNVVVVGTFSKCFAMMGWRVGFMLADAAICAQAIKIQDAMIICAPVISQLAAESAVRQAWTYAASFHEELMRRRERLVAHVDASPHLQWSPTAGAFFGLVAVRGCSDAAALAHSLLEEVHVVTIPGTAFGRSSEGHLRLSYGSAGLEEVDEAMIRLRRFFDARAGACGIQASTLL